MLKKSGLVSLLLFWSILGYSQADGLCQQNLDKASEEFELGHFYDVPGLLNNCLDKGFSDAQKIQAYYLLTRTYLLLDKLDSADATYLEVLRLDPEFEVTEETGTIEMVYLSQNFTTSPILSIKAEGGTNFSTASIVHSYGIEDTDNSRSNFSPRWGFGLGAGIELHFSNTLSIEITPTFVVKRYREQNVFFEDDIYSAIESNFQFDLPIAARYTFEGKQIRPYVYAGGVNNFLLSSKTNADFSNVEGDAETPVEGDDVRNGPSRKRTTWSLLFGVGGMYKIGYNYFHLEFQYMPGLNLLNDPTNRFQKEDISGSPVDDNGHYGADFPFKYPKVDQDFRLNTYSITAGYTIPLYKPRKKDKFTLRDWFDEISEKLKRKEK